jgi:hypothetical protein
MCAASSCFAPSVWAIVSTTSAGSRTGDSPIQNTPAPNSLTSSPAASSANRVFPVPPGPASVTSGAASSRIRATTSRTSCSRPTNEESGTGRFVFEIVRSGGKRSDPSWYSGTGSAKSFNRCLPKSSTSSATNSRVAAESSTWPPWAALMILAALCTSGPTYFGGSSSGSPVCTPTRLCTNPLASEAIACATARTASDADANA